MREILRTRKPAIDRWKQRCQRIFFLGVPSVVLALGLLLLAGCSKSEPARGRPPLEKGQEGKGQQYTLAGCIELWSAGKQAEAVEQFTSSDWSRGALFSPGDQLSFSDQQMARLAESERAHVIEKVRSLKGLGMHVGDLAKKAQGRGDAAKGEKYTASVSKCGEVLDQPQYCTMLRQVGKAFKKLAQ